MSLASRFAVNRAKKAATKAAEKAATKVAKAAPQKPMAVKPKAAAPKAKPKVKALPAPQKPLALPPPGPGLPSFAVKPKGGQWWADAYIGGVRPSDLGVKVGRLPDDGRWFARDGEGRLMLFDTEDKARSMSQNWVDSFNKNASVEKAVRRIADNRLGLVSGANGPLSQLQSWFLRAAPRYIKNEMGTPDDPMRALAERGNLHVALTPDEWSQAAGDVIKSDTIGDVLGLNSLYPKEGAMPGAGDDFRASVVTNMPWLIKAPVTDKVYRIGDTHTLEDKMGLSHLLDEMRNAMHERTDLPPDLAVRPESLGRMGLAQAAERVGLINQWRAKQAEQAALSAMDSPVVHTFKEYAEDNPMGLRWVEVAPPKGDGPSNYDVEEELQRALRYEGDTMGHCVGGYCDDVLGGRSRIFSLRDAKGEPHVTIEAAPRDRNGAALEHIRSLGVYPEWVKYSNANRDMSVDAHDLSAQFLNELGLPPVDYSGQDIIQIKGKQNRAPKDDYVPFVQDFVKSGQWGNVGDLNNTGLVKLPDGRYIQQGQWQEGMRNAVRERNPNWDEDWLAKQVAQNYATPGMIGSDWDQIAQHFEGYAIGGRVSADRCFSRHPMSVKRAA